MKLFIVHAGFYDEEIGIYELHTNFIIAALNVKEAKMKVKNNKLFIKKNMHIDAVQEIEMIDGFKVVLIKSNTDASQLNNYDYSQIKEIS